MSDREEPFLTGAWRPAVDSELQRIVDEAGPEDFCVFDFDNTVLCEDIGEATHARLFLDGAFAKTLADENLSPPIFADGRLRSARDFTAVGYYEALAETVDELSAYAWIVEALAGLTAAAVTRATRQARRKTREMKALTGPGFGVPRPFVRPEVADLIEALRRTGARVAIVSASNVWSVRAMVRAALDPMLSKPFPLDQVFAVSTLMRDQDGALRRDADLVREDSAYRELHEERLEGLRLTARLAHPLPAFEGKVAVIRRFIDPQRRPLLVAGDSLNDMSMLNYGENRLLFARVENPGLQAELRARLSRRVYQGAGWMVQPVSQGPEGRLHSGVDDMGSLSAGASVAWSGWDLD